MSRKAVIVKVKNGTAYCEFKDDMAVRTDIFYDDEKNILGNIYVGYVKDIVKNINCAFVEYEQGRKAYLQLSDKCRPVFLNRKNTDKLCSGDRIIVQITKEAVKTKDPVCKTEFELVGKYAVLTHGTTGISFSQKIKDESFKKCISETLYNNCYNDNAGYGILIRTNAYEVSENDILSEVNSFINEYEKLINTAMTRTKNFLLKEADNPLLSILRDLNFEPSDRIVTDDENIYNILKEENINGSPELYTDDLLPLYKLCSLEKVFDDVSNRKIWLKSGAYLIIDYTEAMTVIDVNTGKCEKGKDKEQTFLKINMEAAKEIARLLSLRNISGIIIVDFIDMKDAENRDKLIQAMKEYVAEDKIKTTVVDFTRLHLMEITRKKTRDMVKVKELKF